MPRRSRKRASVALETAGRLATAIGEHPREFVALVMVTIAVFGIVTNALFLQKGPHPAPIFATRPLLPQGATLAPRLQSTQSAPATDTANQARLQLIANIQRELTHKGFYDGPADGIWGSKTDPAVRDFIQAAGLKINAEPSDALLRTVSTSSAKPSNTGSGIEHGGRPDRQVDCAIGCAVDRAVKAHHGRTTGARRFWLRPDQADRRS